MTCTAFAGGGSTACTGSVGSLVSAFPSSIISDFSLSLSPLSSSFVPKGRVAVLTPSSGLAPLLPLSLPWLASHSEAASDVACLGEGGGCSTFSLSPLRSGDGEGLLETTVFSSSSFLLSSSAFGVTASSSFSFSVASSTLSSILVSSFCFSVSLDSCPPSLLCSSSSTLTLASTGSALVSGFSGSASSTTFISFGLGSASIETPFFTPTSSRSLLAFSLDFCFGRSGWTLAGFT